MQIDFFMFDMEKFSWNINIARKCKRKIHIKCQRKITLENGIFAISRFPIIDEISSVVGTFCNSSETNCEMSVPSKSASLQTEPI